MPAALTGKAGEREPRARVGSRVGAVTWTVSGKLAYPEWLAAGRRIGAMGRASNWWIGDWIRYGTERWGEKYVAAARLTGYDTHSLRNMAYVASRFQSSLRRDDLTWSHHALLAALGQSEQRRWLDRASSERMSVADLRTELRSAKRAERQLHATQPLDSGARTHGETAAEGDSVCPTCGHATASAASDWSTFVGQIIRRRYAPSPAPRRAA
jgi:hypothetical protein